MIYAIVDEIGTPRYVGQTTKPLSLRLSQHRSAAKINSRPLDIWLRGCPGASIVPLECNPVDKDEAERRWIAQMQISGLPILNLLSGGRKGSRGMRHSPEGRRRISEARCGKPLSPEHREKLSAAHTGVRLGDEHRAAIGRGGKGRKASPEVRANMSAAKMGDRNPMSAKQRAARAARLQGGDAL